MSDAPKKRTTRSAGIEPSKKILTAAQRKRLQVKAFRPVAIELGWLVYEWNRLHESLGEIFANIIVGDDGDGDNIRPALAAWHTLTNERAQREMLRAALNARYLLSAPKPKSHREVSWVLNKLGELAGRRNDAIHAPLALVSQFGSDENSVEIMPLYFFGNPRATSLKGRSLLEEFRWYRNHFEKLADYAESLIFAIKFSDYTWRDRPELPPRAQFVTHAAQRNKTKPK
jgi:hypothetical protein